MSDHDWRLQAALKRIEDRLDSIEYRQRAIAKRAAGLITIGAGTAVGALIVGIVAIEQLKAPKWFIAAAMFGWPLLVTYLAMLAQRDEER